MSNATSVTLPRFPLLDADLGLETLPSRDLCHYTSQRGLIGILKEKAMYATDARYLNDSQELVYAVRLGKKYLKNEPITQEGRPAMDMQNLLDRTIDPGARMPVYVASFSEQPDQLSQWRGYCSTGSGFALCLSPDRVKAVTSEHGWQVFKCVYEEGKQIEILEQIKRYAENRFAEDNTVPPEIMFAFILGGVGVAMKHPKFAEESEWRAIQLLGGTPSIRPGASTLTPYLHFPLTVDEKDSLELSKLVVGPTPHVSLALMGAEYLLQSNKVNCKQIVSSEIPFRNW